jgi:nucleotide-binding universal stress UspA family protein
MINFLVAIDGSDNARRAVEYVIKQAGRYKEPLQLHLLNVQVPLVGVNVKLFIKREDLNAYYHDEGTVALKTVRERLDAAGIAFVPHIGVGHPGEVIVQYAVDKDCEQIVMGSRGLGSVSNLVLGSVATKVIHLAQMPVLLVK